MVDIHNNKRDYSAFRPIGYPVRHRRKVPFNPTLSLGTEYREIIRRIRELDRKLDDVILSSDDYLELVNDAFSDNIHRTTRIEGNNLSLDAVKDLTDRLSKGEMIEADSGDEQEVINQLYVTFSKEEWSLPWDTDRTMLAHRLLMKDVDKSIIPGRIREENVSVVGQDGTEYFRACPPGSIAEELESLVEWLNGSPYDEIITATIFFHEFESIHPFRDGNGRTGRLLFQMLLKELGLKNCIFCKYEKEILGNPSVYYDLLSYTDSVGVYSRLVMYVAESLLTAYEDTVRLFTERDLSSTMDERERMIVGNAKKIDSFTIIEASQWIPDIGQQTLRDCIEGLAEIDVIQKTGRTKGLRYSFKDPFFDVRNRIELGITDM